MTNDLHLPTRFALLPLRNGVLLPGSVVSLPMGRKQSVALAKSLSKGDIMGVGVQKDAKIEDPALDEMLPVGTYARVHDVVVGQGIGARVVIESLGRFRLDTLVRSHPYWLATGSPVAANHEVEAEVQTLVTTLLESIKTLAPLVPGNVEQLVNQLADVTEPGLLADRVAANLGLDAEREIEILLALDVTQRLKLVIAAVHAARSIAEIKQKIDSEVRQGFSKHQKEAVLREQMKAIRKELGEDEERDEVGELKAKLADAKLPEEVRTVAERELRRLETMNAAQPDHNVVRTYLEWILALPWETRADGKEDINKVAERLEADHYGMADVKKRILEHLAVMKVAKNPRGSIVCLAGPPGVGKTSLGQSIADALGRPFVRVALGGVSDEAEIRGHRRTYVGALPGRIMHALRKAGAKNPVFLLDEVDKLGQGWRGSPEAALLEVLDPEQNRTFQDHYMELPFDLSEVLFICTANALENLSPPLRDRLEIIEMSGYTLEEKQHIARRHLMPKALKEHGLHDGALTITDGALRTLIAGYTREAGVRQLSRELTKICRALTLEQARSPDMRLPPATVGDVDVSRYLGKVKFFNEVAERTSVAGVATGMAWTPVGGDILFIETSRMPGKGRLEITGQLGDVMKESARAALSYVRANAAMLGVDAQFLDHQDLHIHIPAGAVPKDGPSAGVTIFTALTSLLTSRKVRSDTSMTGECTLRGRVLPVGGIKEKVLAARRAGISRVILPKKNERDLDELPGETRRELEFIFADDMSQVLHAALEQTPTDKLLDDVVLPVPNAALITDGRDRPAAPH